MLLNSQMRPNRFLVWHNARRRKNWLDARFADGLSVLIVTATRATKYQPKHADMFKATRSGCFVRRGKIWDCIDGCSLRAVRY